MIYIRLTQDICSMLPKQDEYLDYTKRISYFTYIYIHAIQVFYLSTKENRAFTYVSHHHHQQSKKTRWRRRDILSMNNGKKYRFHHEWVYFLWMKKRQKKKKKAYIHINWLKMKLTLQLNWLKMMGNDTNVVWDLILFSMYTISCERMSERISSYVHRLFIWILLETCNQCVSILHQMMYSINVLNRIKFYLQFVILWTQSIDGICCENLRIRKRK